MVNPARPPVDWLARLAPGLAALLRYRRGDFPHDVAAGLSVAAVALPVGVAYAQLAGFEPVFGLYASILPLVAYALFGTSRQLVVGPDAATCALVASAVAPLAGGDPALYLPLAVALTGLTGLICLAASVLRLAAIADFLSRPILVGFLNGISLHILFGQMSKLFGFPIDARLIVPTLLEIIGKLGQTHWPTLAVGLGAFAVLHASSRLLPRLPDALVALAVAGAVSAAAGLEGRGVAVVGAVPPGLPPFSLPSVPLGRLGELVGPAAGVALVSFTSMILTARSFAMRNHYDLDVDREVIALGAANLAAAVSQAFAVSGADSRTAVADAAGGRTQLTGLVAAATIAVVLLFLTGPLRHVPVAALAAVLVRASISLLDIAALGRMLRFSRFECALSLVATVGVIWVGAIQAIVVAVVLALLHFVHVTARPATEILGAVEGLPGLHALARHPEARTEPGLLLFRFNGPLVFFNATYFRQRVLAAIAAEDTPVRWFVLDALPLTDLDLTGYEALEHVSRMLRAQGAEFIVAGRMTEVREQRARRGIAGEGIVSRHFPTLRQAVRAYRAMRSGDGAGQEPPAAPGQGG